MLNELFFYRYYGIIICKLICFISRNYDSIVVVFITG